MKRKTLPMLAVILLVGLLVFPTTVWAHQTTTVGDYDVEYGWVNEPAVVGQPNAVVINLTKHGADPNSSAPADAIDTTGFQVQVVYGGQTKMLTLQPLGENTPGQYIAPITPMRPGKYTVHLGGNIGTTNFNSDVQPEEIQTADIVQFPSQDLTQGAAVGGASSGLPIWAGIAGLLLGGLGTLLGVIALIRKPARA